MGKVAYLESDYSYLLYLLIDIKDKELIKVYRNVELSSIFKIFKRFKMIYEYLFIIKIMLKYNIVYSVDHTRIGNKLLFCKEFILIEDGLMNYKEIKESNIKIKIKKILLKNRILGRSKNVKKIYLTGLAPIPKELLSKVEIVNLKKLWNNKKNEEKKEILKVFSFNMNIIKKIKERSIILFTQPLSEDKILTENEKIKIYSKIIKKYSKDKLIIKIHPREKTDYKEIFKDCLILDNPFPFEIMNLLDIKFKKAVTLFSTAALNLGENTTVDFYGTEVNNKIFKRFGSCDNIMVRNCFLEDYDGK